MTNQNGKSTGKKIALAFFAIAAVSVVYGIISVSLIVFMGLSAVPTIALISVFAVVVAVIAIVAGVVLPKKMEKKVSELSDKVTSFSKGNFNVSFRTNDSYDIDVLSNKIADITDAFGNVVSDISGLSKKVEDGAAVLSVDEGAYSGNFKKTASELNFIVSKLSSETNALADAFRNYVDGNFDDISLNFSGEKAAFNNIADDSGVVFDFFDSLDSVISSAAMGDFSKRINENVYSGEFKDYAVKINTFIKSVDKVMLDFLRVFNDISQQNTFGSKISGNYDGVFGKIKNAVNGSIDVIGDCLREFVEIFNEISKFNLDVSLNGYYKGDFEVIKNYVNIAIGNFNELISNFEDSIKRVNSESKQISRSSSDLSGKTIRQTDAINRLNEGISKLLQQSVENEKSTSDANEIAVIAKESISVGNEQMGSMLSAMNAINDTSNSISNIIKVIDDIAFQTNILALNAAVEAARAGEHGKGFAVVADEVRTLASRTQQAAKEITELIESAIEKISDGSAIAHNTAESLSDIIEKINNISAIIEKTSRISSEQGSEIEALNKGISEIDSVAREISRAAEAMASNNFAKDADSIMASISKFKLKSRIEIEQNKQLNKTIEQNKRLSLNSAPIKKEVRENRSAPPLNITSERGVQHIPEGSPSVADAVAASVPKASAPVNYDIDVIDFDKTKDFGKY